MAIRSQLVVRARGLTRSFGATTGLDGLDLDVRAGETVGLLGPNGAGKSTLISLLVGLRRAQAGVVELFGGDPRDARNRRLLGLTPQDTGLPATLRVGEVVRFVAHHFPDPVPCAELLERFGLAGLQRRQTGGLSGGQRRRLAVALAFVGRPRLVVLDEPTTGLDVEGRHTLWEAVRGFRADGGTVLLTSHYLEEIENTAGRVVVLDNGRVLADGSVEEIRAVVALSRVSLRSTVPPPVDGSVSCRRVGDHWELETPDADAFIRPGRGAGPVPRPVCPPRHSGGGIRLAHREVGVTAQQGPPAPEDRGVGVHVTVLHWRYLMLEQLRTPMGFLSAAAFPALSLLFFVVPFDYGGDPVAATVAVAGLAVFAVTNSFLFTFGVGVADDWEKPWDPYLRSLPASAAPRIAGRLLCGASYGLIAAVPVVVVGALFTAATTSPARLLLGLIALPVVGVPFLLGGLAIGYSLPVKVALPVTQLVFFPIAFAGGLLLPPQLFPPWLQVLSLAAPSRGARELVVWAVADVAPDGRALLILVGWTVLTGLLAVRAYTVTRDADSADRGRSWSASAPARPAETASRGRAVRPEPRNLSIS